MSRTAGLILTAAAVSWVVLVLAAPVALAHGYTILPAIVYEAGGLICHQRPERSFHLAGIQLPICARCFGLYASGAVGAIAACAAGLSGAGRRPLRSTRVLLTAAAIPTAVTLVLEWSGLAHPGGATRAVAAVPLGALAGWVFVHLLTEETT